MNDLTCCAHTEDEHEDRPEYRRTAGYVTVVTAPLRICYACCNEYYEERMAIPWWNIIRHWHDMGRPLTYRHAMSRKDDVERSRPADAGDQTGLAPVTDGGTTK